MTDPFVYLMLVVGFGAVIVGGSKLGAGAHLSLEGLWAPHGRSDWPRRVQEGDAPHFALAHVDALRPGTPVALNQAIGANGDDPWPEIIELDVGPKAVGSGDQRTIVTVRTTRLRR